MTVEPTARLSALETLQHPWLRDEAVARKANDLMDSHRRPVAAPSVTPGVSCLNGILDDVVNTNNGNNEKDGGAAVKENPPAEDEEVTFKRPRDEPAAGVNGGQPCKRVRNE